MKKLLINLIHARDYDLMMDAIYRLSRYDLSLWIERQPHITLAAAEEIKERLDDSDDSGYTTYHIIEDELWLDFCSAYSDDPNGYKSFSRFITKIIP